MHIQIANPYDYMDCQFVWVIQISNLYVHTIVFCIPLLLRRWKLNKIHHIFFNNARTPPETKYASKPPLTEATYTKWWRFCGKKWHCRDEKLLVFINGILGIFENCWVPWSRPCPNQINIKNAVSRKWS